MVGTKLLGNIGSGSSFGFSGKPPGVRDSTNGLPNFGFGKTDGSGTERQTYLGKDVEKSFNGISSLLNLNQGAVSGLNMGGNISSFEPSVLNNKMQTPTSEKS
jgi:hypothetical protein